MTIVAEPQVQGGMAREDRTGLARRVSLPTLATFVVVAAMLHLGSTVFLPLAIATLLAFALSPFVTLLRTRGLPNTLAVLSAVTIAFATLGFLLAVMASQLSSVAENLPRFQANILEKLSALQATDGSSSVFGGIIDMLTRINTEISNALPSGQPEGATQTATDAPLQVAVVEHQSAWRVLQDIVLPVFSPVVTAGLVVVVVIFMLLERDELRDRFIRLVGSNDLHRTTEMLEDAGSRVASYLLIQLLVNVIYAVPIGLGLWLIGVPNPVLCGMLTLFLRFVPYLGTALSAAIPLFLAFAVSPDWSMVLWTAALFAVVELVTSNIVEPWLYGSRTGLSPLAIIVSAIVWTWIWGPLGLILSTPMTVCLVVLGRYLPQFELFDILFGDEPVLHPHARLYQRLLAGDVLESASRAEEALETVYLADYYQGVGLPALLLAQADYDRGVLSQEQEDRIARSAGKLVEALAPVVLEERDEAAEGEELPDSPVGAPRILVVGGRSKLDDVAAEMLGQALAAEGAEVTAAARGDLLSLGGAGGAAAGAGLLILNFLDPNPARASLLILRRIKRAAPHLRVGVVVWQMPDELSRTGGFPDGLAPAPASALKQAEEIGADFAASTLAEAMSLAFRQESPKPLSTPQKRQPRKPLRRSG